jgi:antitoxin CptB
MAREEEMGEAARRRKRLAYQCTHRGMKEMDLLLGEFAQAVLDHLTGAELDVLEALLEVPDDLLYRWIAGQEPAPAEHDTGVFRRLAARAARRGSGTD